MQVLVFTFAFKRLSGSAANVEAQFACNNNRESKEIDILLFMTRSHPAS